MLTDTANPHTPRGVFVVPVPDKSTRRAPRRSKKIVRRGILVLVLVLGVFVGGLGATGSDTVQANPLGNFFCDYTDPPATIEEKNPGDTGFYAWPGQAGNAAQVLAGTSANQDPTASTIDGSISEWVSGTGDSAIQPYPAGQPTTAYEWYGTAGLSWTSANYEDIGGQCGLDGIFNRSASNILSNIIWGLVSTLGAFGLLLYYYAASPNALAPFLGEDGPIDSLLSNSLDGIFLVFITPIIVLTALYFAYIGLVKRRSSETIQGVIWMIGASAAAIFLFVNPLTVPNFINTVVGQIQTTTLSVITSSTASGGAEGGLCTLPEEPTLAGDISPELREQLAQANRERSIRISQCVQWQVFLFTPWAVGQFGDLAATPVNGATPVTINDVPLSGASDGGADPGTSMALVQLDAVTINRNQVLRGGLTAAERAEKVAQRQLIYEQMRDIWNVPPGEATSGQIGAVATWTGADPNVRLGAAFLALMSMLLGGVPIFLLTFSLLLYQLGTLFLLLLAPVFLTLGINPGWGRRIALGWLEQLINLSIKRIGTTILIAILLAVIQAIVFSGGAWLAQVFLIAATGIGILVFRGRILSMLASVNLGGTNAIDVEEATRQGGKKAAGVATGALVGGGMALAGGAGVAGAVKAGGVGASTGLTGKTTTAAVVGYGTANQAINQADEKKEKIQAKKDAEEYEELMAELDTSDSGLSAEDIQGIRETRRNMGASEGLLKAKAVQRRVEQRQGEQAEALENEAKERERLVKHDPILRSRELTEEQARINADQERVAAEELARLREEDQAMAHSGTVEHAQMWIDHWQGNTPSSGGGGRPVPRPEDPALREALMNAGVPMREWAGQETESPTVSAQQAEEVGRRALQRLQNRANTNTGSGGDPGGADGVRRPPQAQ